MPAGTNTFVTDMLRSKYKIFIMDCCRSKNHETSGSDLDDDYAALFEDSNSDLDDDYAALFEDTVPTRNIFFSALTHV